MGKLSDKVAIVTGASRGIGAATARALAAEGASVVLAARKIDAVAEIALQIESRGATALAVACHVGQPDQVAALVKAALDRFGRIDVLVNNAGTNPYFGPLLGVDWPRWDKTFEVNLKGYFAPTQLVCKHLVDRKAQGSIVNIASINGLRAAPMQGVYAMTKAAVISMTQTLAFELGSAGIRVNAIAPGLIETKLSAGIVQNPILLKNVMERTAAGRVGQPEEIARVAVFLASDDASYVTGAILTVDGGTTLL